MGIHTTMTFLPSLIKTPIITLVERLRSLFDLLAIVLLTSYGILVGLFFVSLVLLALAILFYTNTLDGNRGDIPSLPIKDATYIRLLKSVLLSFCRCPPTLTHSFLLTVREYSNSSRKYSRFSFTTNPIYSAFL